MRQKLLAKIHIGKKELCMEDDDYRALLARLTGKTSARVMNINELSDVLSELKRLGFKAKRSAHIPPLVFSPRAKYRAKIEAILSEYKLPWAYAESTAQRMFGKKISYLSQEQIYKLMQALAIYQQRQKKKEDHAPH